MAPMTVLLVGTEKDVPDMEEALEAAKRTVGGVKVFSATKAVEAVSRLQKAVSLTGACHAAFLSNHFTAKNKEEFSETLRKVLKEKYSDVPVVCWGHVAKGGKKGKEYHAGLDVSGGVINVAELSNLLQQIKRGEIVADYSLDPKKARAMDASRHRSQDGASTPDRRSLDMLPPRSSAWPSIDVSSPTGAALARRRKSKDTSNDPSSPAGHRRSLDVDLTRTDSMSSRALSRSNLAPGVYSPRCTADLSGAPSAFSTMGGASGGMGSGTIQIPNTYSGVCAMDVMLSRSNFSSMSAAGMINMGSMGTGNVASMGVACGISNGSGSGSSMGSMMPIRTSLNGASSINSVHSMGSSVSALPMSMGMGATGQALSLANGMAGMMQTPAMAAAIPGMAIPSHLTLLRASSTSGASSGPVSPMAPAATAVVPAMSMATAAPPVVSLATSSSSELITMLGAEVMRLTKLVEEKKARESATNGQPPGWQPERALA